LRFGGPAQEWGIDFGWEVMTIQLPNQRMPKQVFFIPAIMLLGLIAWLQWRRRGNTEPTPAADGA